MDAQAGIEVVAKKKGTFVDGHVEWFPWGSSIPAMLQWKRQRWLCLLHTPEPDVVEKTIVPFHDETTFQANEDQPTLWTAKGTSVMRPKSNGSGIMVSDFIDEKNGYSKLT